MKKITLLLMVLCIACLSFCAMAESAEAPVQEAAAEEAATPTLHDVRYYFEHRLLPSMYYDDPEKLLDTLRDPGAFDIWLWLTEQVGMDVTYQEENFRFRELNREDGIYMLIQELPKPEDTPLCSRLYFCYQAETKTAWYYTIEYDNFFGESYFLCAWTQDGNHLDFGTCPTVDSTAENYEDQLAAEADLVAQSILGSASDAK